jgi:hypothetical protein
MNYTKHQITRETKAAEIYKGDSIKQNIRAINYQTRKGVQKAPFRVFLHIWERLYKR